MPEYVLPNAPDFSQRLTYLLKNPPKVNRLQAAKAKPVHQLQFAEPTIPRDVRFSEIQKNLPAYAHRLEFLQAIKNHRIVIVAGDTGCGKSSQIPQYLLDDCHRTRTTARILCTQPRRIATVAMAERVAVELDTKLGGMVGYQIRNDSLVGKSSNLIFMTK